MDDYQHNHHLTNLFSMKYSFVGLHSDFFGLLASLLCIVHCLSVPILTSLLPLTGLYLVENPLIEIGIIILSLVITVYALTKRFNKKNLNLTPIIFAVLGFAFIFLAGWTHTETYELTVKFGGVLFVCLAHVFNWRLSYKYMKKL